MFGFFYARTREGRANREAVEDALREEGPVLIAIHGTFAGSPDNTGKHWWQRRSPFMTRLQEGLEPKLGSTRVLPFHWTGANSEFDRIVCGRRLAAVMRHLEKKKRPYHVLAHSHGGNLVVEAISRFTRVGRKQKQLSSVTTFGTPYFRRHLKPMSKGFLFYRAMLLAALIALAAYVLTTSALGAATSIEGSDAAFVIGTIIGWLLVAGVLLLPIYFLWRSVAPAARNKARFVKAMRKTGLDRRWLALWAKRDEAIGLLMRATAFKAQFITSRSMGRTLRRTAATLAAFAIIMLPLAVLLFAPNVFQSTTEQIAQDAEARLKTVEAYIPAGIFAIVLFFYALPLFAILHIALSVVFQLGPQHASAWVVNRTIISGIRTGMFGDDANFALRGVSRTPEKLEVVTLELDSDDLDGFADDDALEAAKLFYKELIEIENDAMPEADPAGVWARLSDAICHNGYFVDETAMAAVVDHIAGGATPGAPAAPATEAHPQPERSASTAEARVPEPA